MLLFLEKIGSKSLQKARTTQQFITESGPVVNLVRKGPLLSSTESAILNRESGDSEPCDSNRAIPRSL